MNDSTFMTLMKLLPKSALSTLVGKATRAPAPAVVHQAVMRAFARRYQVALDEAEQPIERFTTFGQFFTRRLKPGARPIDPAPDAVVSPCDGAISQVGTIEQGRCLQAKGLWFPVDKLLGDARRALAFEGGSFATIYLAPRDYHRFHAPLEGHITGYSYLPGAFWPVNQASVASVEALFAVNERLVTWLDTPLGQVAYVAVGATCVSRIHAAYDAVVTHTGHGARSSVYPRPLPIERGGEIGMFEMGSTVIVLFEKGRLAWDPALAPGVPVRLGQRLATRLVGGAA
ncbi:MAG: phosphatidylserine decarboxylase [Myxococcaceae bacterium]|jgi:phosphatidylserine decarboxylase|nr:phosphatidylserine decarboxylase [Myxococcaceae bacterium]MCA3011298.1 phosphatidylserine decarboxylase [Myxococcaceae bacterium]